MVLLQACISPKTYLMSESLRVHFEQENTSLKQDTTLLGIRYRNAAKLNTELIAKMSTMTIDTARLNRQLRFFMNQSTNSTTTKPEMTEDLPPSQKALKEKEAALSLKEAELDAKERELHFKELEMKSITVPQRSGVLNPNVEALYKKVKSVIGSYGVDNVSIEINGDNFQINIPNYLLFLSNGKEVQGKGLAILIKLAELLKNQPVFVKIINETKSSTNVNSWNLATQQSAELANLIGRYGFPSQNIVVAVREAIPESNNPSFTRIYVSHRAFQ